MMRALFLALILAVAAVGHTGPVFAVQPDEMLDDPELEARAREISKDIRCLVCQNQSIDDSNADLARDLRILVRERLVAGDSNQEVKDFLVDRYGAYVLLTPPLRITTILLWAAPILLIGLGGIAVVFWFRARRRDAVSDTVAPAEATLSDDEKRRLDELLAEDGGNDDRDGDARA